MANFVDIKSVTGGDDKLVKQDLKFRTGKFVWKVIFNIELNPATVNNDNLQVYNSQNTLVATKISYNSSANTIEIEPKEPYSSNEVYTLHVGNKVESKGGQRLKNDISIEFAV